MESKRNACYVTKRNIEVQAELWYRNKAAWPATDLGDIAADGAYLPEGQPACPVDASGYTLDAATGRVVGHEHP